VKFPCDNGDGRIVRGVAAAAAVAVVDAAEVAVVGKAGVIAEGRVEGDVEAEEEEEEFRWCVVRRGLGAGDADVEAVEEELLAGLGAEVPDEGLLRPRELEVDDGVLWLL
jgi:hypothetical protein